MKVNANQLRAALERPNAATRLILLHGPDEAGARASAAQFARGLGADAERIDLEPATLRADPARLPDEAAALSLFGAARFVRVEGMGEESLAAVEALLAAPAAGNPVVAIAPGVKASGKLVKLVAAAPNAVCFACYVPEGEQAAKLVEQLAREQGMRPAGGVADRLVSASGGDRAIVARELEKLALYLDAAPDRPRELTGEALDAIGADAGEGELAAAVDAILDGQVGALAEELARLQVAGVSPVPLFRQLARRLMMLAELRGEVEAGASAATVVERHNVFFKERGSVQRALRRWTSVRLTEAIDRARSGERAIMAANNAGAVIAEQALTAIARMAARLR